MTFPMKLASVLLAVGVLAGCGGASSKSAASPPAQATDVPSSTDAASAQAQKKYPKRLRAALADGRPRHRRPLHTAPIYSHQR